MTEFELIDRFFARGRADGVPAGRAPVLGIGDDCALLAPPAPGRLLAISTDMLVEGRHFFAGTEPQAVGHKALAVNLSDLAAMGAEPLGFTLALALPEVREDWLDGFSSGLLELAGRHGCPLVGGDTTRGPLCISITVLGSVAADGALRRDAAQPGDDIWVSGRLGAAAAAVAARAAGEPPAAAAAERLDWPRPRLALGRALVGLAHAAIDLSDGLAGDLGHILKASAGPSVPARLRGGNAAPAPLGAELELARLPIDPVLARLPDERQLALALSGGDDYELLFTASPVHRERIVALAVDDGFDDLAPQRIGTVVPQPGIRLIDAAGDRRPLAGTAFDHFASGAGR